VSNKIEFSPDELVLGMLLDNLRKKVTGEEFEQAVIDAERWSGCASVEALRAIDRLRGSNKDERVHVSPWCVFAP
jgi:hypothetical protein